MRIIPDDIRSEPDDGNSARPMYDERDTIEITEAELNKIFEGWHQETRTHVSCEDVCRLDLMRHTKSPSQYFRECIELKKGKR